MSICNYRDLIYQSRLSTYQQRINASYTYSYDTAGNILEKKKYPYSTSALVTPIETKTYTYASTGWKDRLISFGGSSISYDVLGNPTSYRGHSLSWGMVRQLESYDQNSFEYNASDIYIRNRLRSHPFQSCMVPFILAIPKYARIIVIYNFATIQKNKCPELLRTLGIHINGYYKGTDGKLYWNYAEIKKAIMDI